MAINLKKGQTINLDKEVNDLSEVTIGLGWKIRKRGGLLKRMMNREEYDLDAVAFLLDANGKIANLGSEKLSGSDVVYYNNLNHPSGHVTHTGDNIVGGAGVEDDEQIIVKLNKLGPQYNSILFLATIYQGVEKKQHFGEVEGAFIRAVDGKGKELARFRLDDDPTYDNMCTVIFGEVHRKGNGWEFRALGDALPEDSFVGLVRQRLAQS